MVLRRASWSSDLQVGGDRAGREPAVIRRARALFPMVESGGDAQEWHLVEKRKRRKNRS